MEGFEKDARGGQARREPPALQGWPDAKLSGGAKRRRARAWRRPRRERQVNRAAVFWGTEGFEKKARGGQARREPAAFQITDEISDRRLGASEISESATDGG